MPSSCDEGERYRFAWSHCDTGPGDQIELQPVSSKVPPMAMLALMVASLYAQSIESSFPAAAARPKVHVAVPKAAALMRCLLHGQFISLAVGMQAPRLTNDETMYGSTTKCTQGTSTHGSNKIHSLGCRKHSTPSYYHMVSNVIPQCASSCCQAQRSDDHSHRKSHMSHIY